MNVYVVCAIINHEEYYLASFNGTLSKSIQDSIVFISKNAAYFYATLIEEMYASEDVLGKAELLSFRKLV